LECSQKDPIPLINVDPYRAVAHQVGTSEEVKCKEAEMEAIRQMCCILEIDINARRREMNTLITEADELTIQNLRIRDANNLLQQENTKQQDLLAKIQEQEEKTKKMWEQFSSTPNFLKQLAQVAEEMKESADRLEKLTGSKHQCAVCMETTDNLYGLEPCMHILCEECADKCITNFGRCYSCQKHVVDKRKVFLM
jgi:DNA repair exonuclease SbcCD ATPase subunit